MRVYVSANCVFFFNSLLLHSSLENYYQFVYGLFYCKTLKHEKIPPFFHVTCCFGRFGKISSSTILSFLTAKAGGFFMARDVFSQLFLFINEKL